MTTEVRAPLDSIMDVLKTETASHHVQAEHHPFQTRLNKGKAPLQDYQRYLLELFHVHQALESHLRRIAEINPSVRAVLKQYQYQIPYLREDLQGFGIDPNRADPTGAVAGAIAEIDTAGSESHARLLGMHYVLEGSKNGSKYISRNLAKAYGLENGVGLKYFDPYGEQQRAYWAQFKADMNEQVFSDDERSELLAGAIRMFQIIHEISDELNAEAAGTTG